MDRDRGLGGRLREGKQEEGEGQAEARTTPTVYIRSIRIQAACQLLAEGELSISQVAHRTIHYDHSHFHRYFTRQMGQSPTQYRNACLASPRKA